MILIIKEKYKRNIKEKIEENLRNNLESFKMKITGGQQLLQIHKKNVSASEK